MNETMYVSCKKRSNNWSVFLGMECYEDIFKDNQKKIYGETMLEAEETIRIMQVSWMKHLFV